MKQIIIFLLLIIVGIMGYNLYRNYQRFHPPNYQYQVPEGITTMSTDSKLLYDYFHAVEELDAFVITQWGEERIDVRNPDEDDTETQLAVATYAKKKAKVRFYETQLLNPEVNKEPAGEPTEAAIRKQLVAEMFYADPSSNSLRIGERSALVYEIQQLLIDNGDSINHDGLFQTETLNALKAFEEKNGLFPDGKLDALTLQYLLNQ